MDSLGETFSFWGRSTGIFRTLKSSFDAVCDRTGTRGGSGCWGCTGGRGRNVNADIGRLTCIIMRYKLNIGGRSFWDHLGWHLMLISSYLCMRLPGLARLVLLLRLLDHSHFSMLVDLHHFACHLGLLLDRVLEGFLCQLSRNFLDITSRVQWSLHLLGFWDRFPRFIVPFPPWFCLLLWELAIWGSRIATLVWDWGSLLWL